jgi:hypothetical protein
MLLDKDLLEIQGQRRERNLLDTRAGRRDSIISREGRGLSSMSGDGGQRHVAEDLGRGIESVFTMPVRLGLGLPDVAHRLFLVPHHLQQ